MEADNKKKVLIKFQTIRNGGAEKIAFGFLDNIESTRLDFSIYSDTLPESSILKTQLKKYEDRIFYPLTNSKNKILRKLNAYCCFSEYCKKNKFDIVHIHLYNPEDNIYSFIAKFSGIKRVILHSHTTDIKFNRLNGIRRLLFGIYRRIAASCGTDLLACSREASVFMFGNKESRIIRNGIVSENFIPDALLRDKVRKELNLSGKFVIGHIGRFIYQKNHNFLIDIFHKVSCNNPDAVLLLVGDGELREEMRDKVSSLGLSDNVVFLDPTDAVAELYQAMDCFVFPSNFEGLGIVAVEAQAAGLRTICADTVPEDAAVTDLFEYMSLGDSAELWAERILAASDGYERRNMSQQIAGSGYDIKLSAQQLEKIYLDTDK